MALFDAPTGGAAVNLTSGSPEYQNAVLGGFERRLKPAYASALKQTKQSFSDRGLGDSGLQRAAELGLQEDYLGKLSDATTGAAARGADVAEDTRRFNVNRSDRQSQLDYLKQEAQQNREDAARREWMNLIGQGGQAVGSMLPTLLALL